MNEAPDQMRETSWRWVVVVFLALIVVGASVRAFRAPWTWTTDQCLFLLYAGAAFFLIAMWGYIWVRHGKKGVATRWAVLGRRAAKPRSTRSFAVGFALWVAIVIALVIYFNLIQRQGS
jgi:hypothetical protein